MTVSARQPRLSVVIPAHNEERVIGRCLDALHDQAGAAGMEVVVVANGCSDATAEQARRHPLAPTVLELPVGDKAAALNAGEDAVTTLPRVYLDADIELGPGAVDALVETLEDGRVHAVAPSPRFVTDGRPWPVRSYYRVWSRLPYLSDAPVGNGVYALSAAGRARFARFPALIADDLFVQRQFAPSERCALSDHHFLVQTPKGIRQLLAVRTRAYYGSLQLEHELGGALGAASASAAPGRAVARAVRRPSDLVDVVVYAVLSALAARRAQRRWRRGSTSAWDRDDSTR